MINDKKFKTTRTAMNYTQKELAKGITTQGTISRMEKNAFEPSREILTALAARLSVDMNDLIVPGKRDQIMILLEKADTLYKNYHYQEVLDLLNTFTSDEFISANVEQHYTFLITASQVWMNHDFSEGIFGFNTMLQKDDFSIYTVLATMELGVVYVLQKNKKRAEYYVAQVPELLERLSADTKRSNPYWYAIIVENLARYYLRTNRIQKSKEYAEQLIHFLNEINSSYNLESAYLTLSSATSELEGNTQKMKRQLATSWALALNAGNSDVLKEATKYMKEFNISTFD